MLWNFYYWYEINIDALWKISYLVGWPSRHPSRVDPTSTPCFSTRVVCLVDVDFLVVILPKVVHISNIIAPNLTYLMRRWEFHILIDDEDDDLIGINCGPFEDSVVGGRTPTTIKRTSILMMFHPLPKTTERLTALRGGRSSALRNQSGGSWYALFKYFLFFLSF